MNRYGARFLLSLLLVILFTRGAGAGEQMIRLQLDEDLVRITDYGTYLKEAELKQQIAERAGEQGLTLSDLQIRKAVMALDKTAKRYKRSDITSFGLTFDNILYCVRWKEEPEIDRCRE